MEYISVLVHTDSKRTWMESKGTCPDRQPAIALGSIYQEVLSKAMRMKYESPRVISTVGQLL